MTLYANTAGSLDYRPTLNGQSYDPVNNGGLVSRLQMWTTSARTGATVVDVGPATKAGYGVYTFSVPALIAGTYYSTVTWTATSTTAPFYDSTGTITVYTAGGSLGSVATYTGNPATNPVDQIRLLLGDTDMTDPLLDDASIAFMLVTWVDPYSAAAASAEQIAAQFAREVSYSGDGVQVGTNELQDRFMTLAGQLRTLGKRLGRAALPYVGGQSKSDIRRAQADTDTVQLLFSQGMHDDRQIAGSEVDTYSDNESPLRSDQTNGGI